MSFILDALKKSESDRQQKATPDISDVPTAGAQSTAPRLLMAITGLLSIIVVILLAVLLWPAGDIAPPPAVQQAAPAMEAAPTPVAPAPADTPAETIPATAAEQAPAITNVAAAEPIASPAAPGNEPADTMKADTSGDEAAGVGASEAAPATSPAAPPPTAEETESYLTFNDLRATGKIALPDMHIDLHVYSDTPSERFVFINMNQYRENATLSEGPRLRQITSDGVLLEYVGTTFLLPRE